PADLTSVSFNDIVNERRWELALENCRFFDLVRWNQATNKLAFHRRGSGETVTFEPGKHEFFPIHLDNIIISDGLIKAKTRITDKKSLYNLKFLKHENN
ncbi:MAG: RagB/SusD family nutrient uptake outer membrane protein, partial [Bacteroidales bacterium]|nr:RagB/SusD family nutrient uptake outer membrane protein [Bacteroidales bacterium]